MQNGVYPYEYMYDWDKFNKTSLPEKEYFYSHLNMEDITDADRDFNINNLVEYHDLCVQRDILLLTDVFEDFMRLEIWVLKYMNSTLLIFFLHQS